MLGKIVLEAVTRHLLDIYGSDYDLFALLQLALHAIKLHLVGEDFDFFESQVVHGSVFPKVFGFHKFSERK